MRRSIAPLPPTTARSNHIAGQSPEGFRVVDVWESEEAVNRFAEVLRTILQEVGIAVPPEMYQPHAFVPA